MSARTTIRIVCLIGLFALATYLGAKTVWVDGPTHLTSQSIALSNHPMVCTGDARVWWLPAYDNMPLSEVIWIVSPWRPVTTDTSLLCEPIDARMIEARVNDVAARLFQSGCGRWYGCLIVYVFHNSERTSARYSWVRQ